MRVLRSVVREARRARAVPLVVTFQPHPDDVLRGAAPPLLCDLDERLARFAAVGIEAAVVQRFDREFAALPAAEFLRSLCAGDARRLRSIVMTPQSAFGHGRDGTPQSVAEVGRSLDFEVVTVDPLTAADGTRISSSRIRSAVIAGRLGEATRLLGRRHAVRGEVVHGDGRGRELGYPTANLRFPDPVALPPDGVYAVRVSWDGVDPLHPARQAAGVASLGVRPTFGGGDRLLEVNLFDISEDLYGAWLRVEFVRRQRGQRHFAAIAALIRQMDRDAERARTILGAARPG
jgi:riboflavin kinase/FMN adenylyltransferase